ncbi:MAG: protein kinase domain-containing protein [Limnospira sp.]
MMNTAIPPGQILRNHYLIVRELGHGGFGRTYLAKDRNRFDELCVLKEFAPQVQGSYGLQKSQELFEREAQILYQLRHPQIPRFQELFREKIGDRGYLFVVQDYVAGSTYRDLLKQRLREGKCFAEAEITQLLLDLLPVLEYIHSLGVIHRDISPDNMIRRESDGLPVLIDFGGVKQIKAQVESQFSPRNVHGNPATRLGKLGYAPDEQMQMGIVYPHSDLYGLAATALVLLTGKEPQQLIDSYHLTWNWQKDVSLSPKLDRILSRMLAHQPRDRYPSVRQVLQALNDTSEYSSPSPTLPPPELPTANTTPTQNQSQQQTQKQFKPFKLSSRWRTVILVVSVLVMGTVGWVASNYWVSRTFDLSQNSDQFGKLSEQERQENLRDRRRNLGLNYNFFIDFVNEEFYYRYPEQRGRLLTASSADRPWRQRWDETANQVLNRLETLSDESRRGLGTYTQRDLNRWVEEANELDVSTSTLFDRADTEFYQLFPERRDEKRLIAEPVIQVWRGIVRDRLLELQQSS